MNPFICIISIDMLDWLDDLPFKKVLDTLDFDEVDAGVDVDEDINTTGLTTSSAEGTRGSSENHSSRPSRKRKADDAAIGSRPSNTHLDGRSISPISSKEVERETVMMKRQRLEKNRESARESRRRKKEQVDQLEKKLKALEQETNRLRLQLNVGKDTIEKEKKENQMITQMATSLIERDGSDAEFKDIIEKFQSRYKEYSDARIKQIEYHLNQLQRLILPTQTTKMILWSLHQDDDFWKEEPDDPGIVLIY
jgi:chromosome segregation ATPase